jgi:ankyrin repeat protein
MDSQRLDDGFNLAVGESDYSLHLINRVAADGNIDLFDHIVGRGADALLSTALHSASACKDPVLPKTMICHLLDKHGMAINSNNDDFRDFIHDADDRGSPLCSAILNRNLAVLHELSKRGANPIFPDQYPISYAVREDGFLPALEPLLDAGVDPDTALETAVIHQNIEAAKICLEFGADHAHALPKALEQVEAKMRSVSRVLASNESPSDPDYKEILERKLMVERDSRAMVELLRTGISGSLNAEL